MEPFSCRVLSFPAYIDSRSLLPRMPDATHATPGHPEARPLCRSGVFLFHRGLPFHQSCFTLIAPNFILCPQLVRTGGRRDTTIRNTMLYHTTLCYAILYDTIMLYHIEVGLPILQHSGQRILKIIPFAKSSDHFLHVSPLQRHTSALPLHYTTLHYTTRYLISHVLT